MSAGAPATHTHTSLLWLALKRLTLFTPLSNLPIVQTKKPRPKRGEDSAGRVTTGRLEGRTGPGGGDVIVVWGR